MTEILEILEQAGAIISLFAVVIIIAGFIGASWRYTRRFKEKTRTENFNLFKVELGSALLLGLEILVLADVIETITVTPTFASLSVLAAIVIVRTAVSWTLTLERDTVNWPASDKFIKSPKNDGVTATVRQTPGAIGYIEYGFAKLAKVDFAQLQNKAGHYVVPNAESGAEALAAVKMPESLVAWLPDPDGAKSYPITSYTWMIFRKDNGNPAKAKAMREMVEYSLTEGQKIADSMGYIPLPPSVVDLVRKASANIK